MPQIATSEMPTRRPNPAARARVLLFVLIGTIAALLVALALAHLYGQGQAPIPKDLLLKFADFEYARQLDRADVVALLGPPTSIEPLQPGIAEVCLWEANYPTILGSDAYRLSLCFDRAEPKGVVAGGLYQNNETAKP